MYWLLRLFGISDGTRHRWRLFREDLQPPRPTHLEHLRGRFMRDEITSEEFEVCAAELIRFGIEDCSHVCAVSFDAALKEMYRGPIRDLPKRTQVTLIDKTS